MFDPSILPPLPPMAKQPPWVPPTILPPLPPMAKQPPWVPPSILPPLPTMAKQPPWVPLGTKDCSQGFCSIYCPQWCYIVFPPPPPFFFENSDADNNNSSGSPTLSPLVITIIGILASAFLLISYYAIISKFCRGRRQQRHQHHRHRDDGLDNNDDDDVAALSRSGRDGEEWHVPPTVGLDEALIAKITVCKYRRGDGVLVGGCSDCPVCLSEFREGESLRLLPKCSHAFHVRCIDTWLRSHSNCPLCRASILQASPAALPQLPAPPPPEADQPEDEMAVAGTSLENGSDGSSKEFDVIEIGGDESQRMRRSFSMGSFHRGCVSVADILGGDMEENGTEAEDGEIVVVGSSSRRSRGEHSKGSSSSHCDSSVVAMKRTLSSGRFCLTRQGRGRDRGRGRGRNSFLLPI